MISSSLDSESDIGRRVAVITEVPPSRLSPGKELRARSIVSFVESAGFVPVLVSTNPSQRVSSKATRLLAALRGRRYVLGELEQIAPTAILVLGLGAPHMLALANRLARNYITIFDTCDSWVLQLRARRASSSVKALPSRLGQFLQRRSRHIRTFSYITARDAQADAELTPRGRLAVIPQQINNPQLRALPAVNSPLTRLVIAADLRSFHNHQFFTEHATKLSRLVREGRIPAIEVYGNPGNFELPQGFVHRGWASTLHTVYEGDTGVIVTNSPGSGVPNKLLEAIESGRPAVVDEQLSYAVGPSVSLLHFWGESRSIADATLAMVQGDAANEVLGSGETWPNLNLSRIVESAND